MKKALPLLFVWLLSAPSDGAIPGVPEWCCGYRDCRPADVRIVRKGSDDALVVVDGRQMALSPGRVYRSKEIGGWYCFRVGLRQCKGGEVSEDCVRCVVEGGHIVQEMSVIPVSAGLAGKYLLIPDGGCRNCHR